MSIRKLEKKVDERGWLTEILRNETLSNKEFGQFFITAAKPGIEKGKHYHTRKKEYFCVIKGECELTLQKIDKEENILSEEKIICSGDELKLIEIEPYYYHIIKNIGNEEMQVLAYVDEVFNPDDPDTFGLGDKNKE